MEEMLTGCRVFLAFPLHCDDEYRTRAGCASHRLSPVEGQGPLGQEQ